MRAIPMITSPAVKFLFNLKVFTRRKINSTLLKSVVFKEGVLYNGL